MRKKKSNIHVAKVSCKTTTNGSQNRGLCNDLAELALNLLTNLRE